jgi:hypothetical protein
VKDFFNNISQATCDILDYARKSDNDYEVMLDLNPESMQSPLAIAIIYNNSPIFVYDYPFHAWISYLPESRDLRFNSFMVLQILKTLGQSKVVQQARVGDVITQGNSMYFVGQNDKNSKTIQLYDNDGTREITKTNITDKHWNLYRRILPS